MQRGRVGRFELARQQSRRAGRKFNGWNFEGNFIKSGPKIASAPHMQYFLSGKTESTNRMATLQIFETLLGLITTFFHFGSKIAIWIKLQGG
jgi:hypothetical protein